MIRLLVAYLVSVLAGYALATIVATQAVIASLRQMGVGVPLGERLAMTIHDLQGMAGTFLPMVAGGYLVAFVAAAALTRWKLRWRTAWFFVAGGVAVVTIHLLLKLSFGITPIAVARTATGLALQGLAGAVGGYLFARLSGRVRRSA